MAVEIKDGKETDIGHLLLPLSGCDDPDVICDDFGIGPERGKVEEPVPFLTVCEVLKSLEQYNYKRVVIVGRLSETDKGTWLDQECSYALITDRFRWPNSIVIAHPGGLAGPAPGLPSSFRWDVKLLAKKAKSVRESTHIRIMPPNRERLAAVYGRLESPAGLVTVQCEIESVCGSGLADLNVAPAQLTQDPEARWKFLQ
jgi:hypothetical protein